MPGFLIRGTFIYLTCLFGLFWNFLCNKHNRCSPIKNGSRQNSSTCLIHSAGTYNCPIIHITPVLIKLQKISSCKSNTNTKAVHHKSFQPYPPIWQAPYRNAHTQQDGRRLCLSGDVCPSQHWKPISSNWVAQWDTPCKPAPSCTHTLESESYPWQCSVCAASLDPVHIWLLLKVFLRSLL